MPLIVSKQLEEIFMYRVIKISSAAVSCAVVVAGTAPKHF